MIIIETRAQLPAALPTIDDTRRHQDRYVTTATTDRDHAASISPPAAPQPVAITLAQLRRAAINGSLQPPRSRRPTINPSCCCLPVALLLAPRRIALFRAHLRRQPNPHSQGRGASAHHRPRVRSLAAFGRRPTCTWLRRSSPASETLHTSGPSYLRNSRRKTCRRVPARPTS